MKVSKVHAKFQHKPPLGPQHVRHSWASPVYGQKTKFASVDESTLFVMAPNMFTPSLVHFSTTRAQWTLPFPLL